MESDDAGKKMEGKKMGFRKIFLPQIFLPLTLPFSARHGPTHPQPSCLRTADSQRFCKALSAAFWNAPRTSLASLLLKFERCTIRR